MPGLASRFEKAAAIGGHHPPAPHHRQDPRWSPPEHRSSPRLGWAWSRSNL